MIGGIGRTAITGLLLALMVVLAGAGTKAPPKFDPPMTVVVVRSSVSGCEPDCPQWIAAEGRITGNTPALFKKALKLAGKKRLPVIITSPGGDVDAALAIGTLIRARKLDVAVGWTFFTGCWPQLKGCKLPKQQAGVYRGTAVTYRAYCASACPFILAAGQQRLLGPGAAAGVHQISTTMIEDRTLYRESYIVVKGKKKVLSRTLISRKPVTRSVTTKLGKSQRGKLTGYLKDMGVRAEFLGIFDKAPPSSIYVLQPQEAASTKLVTAFLAAGSLVDASRCQGAARADNCVKLAPPSRKP
ncbi:MAG TPA: hypothetical protein VMZ01_01945 [Aestuariivirga sp.]|nr:hypothetical protein [Aestuariivirga sp.]